MYLLGHKPTVIKKKKRCGILFLTTPPPFLFVCLLELTQLTHIHEGMYIGTLGHDHHLDAYLSVFVT